MSDSANLDIRFPIGVLFIILGVLLSGYGLFAGRGAMRPGALPVPVNVDLWWGIVMLVFGVALFVGARVADAAAARARATSPDQES